MQELSIESLEIIDAGGYGRVIEATAGSVSLGNAIAIGAAAAAAEMTAPVWIGIAAAAAGAGLIIDACN